MNFLHLGVSRSARLATFVIVIASVVILGFGAITYQAVRESVTGGLTPEEARRISPAHHNIRLSARPTVDGILVEWRSGDGAPENHYRVFRRPPGRATPSNPLGWGELIQIVEVQESLRDDYKYLDRSVTPGAGYSYQIVEAEVSGRFVRTSNRVDVFIP